MPKISGLAARPVVTPLLIAVAAIVLFHGQIALRHPAYWSSPQWDEALYLGVAKFGYVVPRGDYTDIVNTVFPPAWPGLLWLFRLLGAESPVYRLVLPAALLLVSLPVLGRVLATFSDDVARNNRVVLLFTFSPGALYFLSGYAEPLYLLLVLLFHLSLLRRRWIWASLAVSAALLTKTSAFAFVLVLGVALAIDAARGPSVGASVRELLRRLAVCLPVCAIGPLLYSAILWYSVDDPLAQFHGYTSWIRIEYEGWSRFLVLDRLADTIAALPLYPTLAIAMVWYLGLPVAVIVARRYLPFILVVSAAVYWLMQLVRDAPVLPLCDAMRWSSVVFPAHYAILRAIERSDRLARPLYVAAVVGALVVHVYCVDRFIRGQWVS